jgi:hypothetical protein
MPLVFQAFVRGSLSHFVANERKLACAQGESATRSPKRAGAAPSADREEGMGDVYKRQEAC